MNEIDGWSPTDAAVLSSSRSAPAAAVRAPGCAARPLRAGPAGLRLRGCPRPADRPCRTGRDRTSRRSAMAVEPLRPAAARRPDAGPLATPVRAGSAPGHGSAPAGSAPLPAADRIGRSPTASSVCAPQHCRFAATATATARCPADGLVASAARRTRGRPRDRVPERPAAPETPPASNAAIAGERRAAARAPRPTSPDPFGWQPVHRSTRVAVWRSDRGYSPSKPCSRSPARHRRCPSSLAPTAARDRCRNRESGPDAASRPGG